MQKLAAVAGLATITLRSLQCMLGLALALLALLACCSTSAGACCAGFPFQIFLAMPLVILSIRIFETSWALILKIFDGFYCENLIWQSGQA